jgi:hypothetical protein
MWCILDEIEKILTLTSTPFSKKDLFKKCSIPVFTKLEDSF